MPVHGGDRGELARRAGVPPGHLLDLSASINPLGLPPWFRQEVEAAISDLAHYPDPACRDLLAACGAAWGLPPERLVAGNGSSELLAAVPAAWAARKVLLPVPCYGEYATACSGLAVVEHRQRAEDGFASDPRALAAAADAAGCDLVIIGSPSNPAGAPLAAADLRAALVSTPRLRWLVDEAFIELSEDPSLLPDLPPNLAVLRSFTKSFACPGLRLGLLAGDAALAAAVRTRLPPWSVNHLAQRVGIRSAGDAVYLSASRAAIAAGRSELAACLRDLGATVIPSRANFLLFRCGDGDGGGLAERLLTRHAIALRSFAGHPGLDRRWLRTAVGGEAERRRLVAALAAELPGRAPAVLTPRRRTPALMVQGTSSGAGKSVLTAALCRIFLQDGLRVCPFKAQNMSLNSGVTRDGLEMGRAQVVQAMAARLEPDVRMNPVLLKPHSETGSQVVVMGRAVGSAEAQPYMEGMRQRLRATVLRAYDELADGHDLMLLEGAGSPGEMNLKDGDLVNMAMARHAGARVLLVGDIDRGGLYASFVGHMEVLEEWERALVGGYVVNRFRGDAGLLAGAHAWVQRHTGRPVLGVIPFRRDLGLPEEDGVAPAEWRRERPGAPLDIACLELRHPSNFTDLDPLRIEPDVQVRLVAGPGELGRPDALIIPGSKNTIDDLAGLRHRGLADAVLALAGSGASEVVGICGGLQILGDEVADPYAIEGARAAAAGLGLLPVSTVLAPEKTLVRCAATHLPSGLPVRGYEIHHGITAMPEPLVILRRADGAAVGLRAPQLPVWGTYLHGVFDDDRFRRRWLDGLRLRRGLPALGAVQAAYDVDAAIDRFADLVRASLDLAAIRRLAGVA